MYIIGQDKQIWEDTCRPEPVQVIKEENMKLIEMMQKRRSIRKYTDEHISDTDMDMIINAGLLSASSRGKRPWEFIVVRDRDTLTRMADCRTGAAGMLKNADAAVVVIADADMTDVWIEGCSITMSNMHLMADSIGVGSCWIQGRARTARSGASTEEYLRDMLGFPENFRLEAVLSLGMPAEHPAEHTMDERHTEKVHLEKFGQNNR